jgi:hypothetical protein
MIPALLRRSVAVLAACVATAGACATYDPPPEPALVGASDSILPDADAPLVLKFSAPIKPASLSVKMYVDSIDPDADPAAPIPQELIFFQQDGGGMPVGGTSTLSSDGTTLTVTFDKRPAVGPRLAIVVEPGLADLAGHTTHARRRIPFGYGFSCTGKSAPTTFASGEYFILLGLEQPLTAQLRIWGDIQVDPATGRFIGQFTHAWRNRDPARCPGLSCNPSKDACSVYPGPACVIPSTNAASVDEFADWVVDHDSLGTFSVHVQGCVQDRPDGTIAFGMEPVDVKTQSPNVTVNGILVVASFAKDGTGGLRGSGSASAESVLLGTAQVGRGRGTFSARLVPATSAPTDIPSP